MYWLKKHPVVDENQMAGKNEYNITVNFPGSKELIGQIVSVRITSAGESTLRGEQIRRKMNCGLTAKGTKYE